MFYAKLKIKISKNDWAFNLVDEFNCSLRAIYCSNLTPSRVLDVIEIGNLKNDVDKVINFIKNESKVFEFEFLESFEDKVFFKVITDYEDSQSIISRVVKFSCFQLSNIEVKDGFEFWNVGSVNKENLKLLVENLRENGNCEVLALEKYSFKDKFLTSKQFDSLNFAFENGFFEVPKKINLDKLSNDFGLAKSTFATHLQKAEKKVIEKFLDN